MMRRRYNAPMMWGCHSPLNRQMAWPVVARRKRTQDRDVVLLILRELGLTYRSIGEAMGITSARARELFVRIQHGLKYPSHHFDVKRRARERAEFWLERNLNRARADRMSWASLL